ncbi:GGDEF domain-containing protein [Pseudomonas japonica]|uniref:GGDEF domain-containing protein n=1 Tax=Pseudomonas japonica TaxID=256466 RepID=UPI0015E2A3D2|nr:GGDEF domain-containing protein [Pseudomonas japonica]MBA1244421.1 GGDEF domain-containing protein [Pseudomonas japonica]
MDTLSASDREHVLENATAQFWKHIAPVVKIAFGIHVVLFVLFLVLDLRPLWLGNIASIAAYVACLRAIGQKRFQLAGMVMCSEIILHAMLATWVLGWESNFYFYLFCIVPILSFSFQTAPLRRMLLSMAILLVAIGGFALRHRLGGAYAVSPVLMETFGFINLFTATALLLHATVLSVRYSLTMQFHQFHSANRDSLTNLYTRRRILQQARQLPQSVPVSVVLLDVDHFKQVNDRHGHDQGDRVLQRVALAISGSVRDTDMAARWGGEEFLVLMLATPLGEARNVAERIRARLSDAADAQALTVTATLGVAQLRPGETFRELFSRADQALYLGKQQGRDRVMLAD